MRKIFLVIIIGILALTGCGRAKSTGFLKLSGISFDADIYYNDSHYTVLCDIDGEKNITAKIVSPENLKDLTFKYVNSDFRIELGDIKIDDVDLYFDKSFLIKSLINIIENSDGKPFSSSKKNCRFSGKTAGNRYNLTVSPGGLPITLQIPDCKLKIIFNNLRLTA